MRAPFLSFSRRMPRRQALRANVAAPIPPFSLDTDIAQANTNVLCIRFKQLYEFWGTEMTKEFGWGLGNRGWGTAALLAGLAGALTGCGDRAEDASEDVALEELSQGDAHQFVRDLNGNRLRAWMQVYRDGAKADKGKFILYGSIDRLTTSDGRPTVQHAGATAFIDPCATVRTEGECDSSGDRAHPLAIGWHHKNPANARREAYKNTFFVEFDLKELARDPKWAIQRIVRDPLTFEMDVASDGETRPDLSCSATVELGLGQEIDIPSEQKAKDGEPERFYRVKLRSSRPFANDPHDTTVPFHTWFAWFEDVREPGEDESDPGRVASMPIWSDQVWLYGVDSRSSRPWWDPQPRTALVPCGASRVDIGCRYAHLPNASDVATLFASTPSPGLLVSSEHGSFGAPVEPVVTMEKLELRCSRKR